MSKKVKYTNFPQQYSEIKEDVLAAVEKVITSGGFILRSEVDELEKLLAEFVGVKHVIGVNSGTDALWLSFKALGIGPGDEVITVAHTFAATIASIVHCGATPVLVDIRDDFNMDVDQLLSVITPQTKAICPVHLNGRLCDMDPIMEVAKVHDLVVVEDAAQALGALYNNKMAGSFGNAGCFSLHPIKNFGIAGDGGFISTNDDVLCEQFRLLRNHGQKSKNELEFFGYNSRLDTLQAAIGLVKFKYLQEGNARRRKLATEYQRQLQGIEQLILPVAPEEDGKYYDVYSSYVVRSPQRDFLKKYLEEQGVEVFVHWPFPLHRQKNLNLTCWNLPMTEKISSEVLSLPVVPEISDSDQEYVIDKVREFFQG